jgi:hypothetical protein
MGEKNALRGHDFHTKKRARFYIQAKFEQREVGGRSEFIRRAK